MLFIPVAQGPTMLT